VQSEDFAAKRILSSEIRRAKPSLRCVIASWNRQGVNEAHLCQPLLGIKATAESDEVELDVEHRRSTCR
jgi:hypothetical protein